MLQTPIINQRPGSNGSGRRYSHLDLSNGSSLLRPRSCSTSMVTVTESTPELRSPADYRRFPATPCSTPCFISPRLAFTTQFSYDSPLQVITCGGGVLKPVVHWWSRFGFRSLLCTKKGLLFIALLTIGVLAFLHLSETGKDYDSPLEGQCDAQDPSMPCHTHDSVNPLQKFLRPEGSIWKPPTSDPEQGDALSTQEGEQEEGLQLRTNRPRMLTVQGQYEGSEEELDDDTSGEMHINNHEEQGEEKGEEAHEETLISRDDLLRARRAVMGEDEDEDDQNSEEQHSMRFLSEEDLQSPPRHPGGVHPEAAPEPRSQEYMNEETLQMANEELDQLYLQHRSLERHGYHIEKQIVEQEIEKLEMLKRRQQMWQEQRRQVHTRAREGHPQPHTRREHWEAGHPPSHVPPHHGESGGMDRQHPAWKDHQLHGQRLPRGVNPRRYYVHTGL